MITTTKRATLAILVTFAPLTAMRGQSGIERTPVVIAVVDKIRDAKDAEVIVIRRVNRVPHDVILLAENRLQSDWLAEAVWTLEALRSAEGNVPTADGTYRVMLRPGSPDRKEMKEYAKDWVRLLKSNPPKRMIDGIGELPQFELYIPNKLPRRSIGQKPTA